MACRYHRYYSYLPIIFTPRVSECKKVFRARESRARGGVSTRACAFILQDNDVVDHATPDLANANDHKYDCVVSSVHWCLSSRYN